MTFLLTGIVSSNSLWQQHLISARDSVASPAAAAAAAAHHEATSAVFLLLLLHLQQEQQQKGGIRKQQTEEAFRSEETISPSPIFLPAGEPAAAAAASALKRQEPDSLTVPTAETTNCSSSS